MAAMCKSFQWKPTIFRKKWVQYALHRATHKSIFHGLSASVCYRERARAHSYILKKWPRSLGFVWIILLAARDVGRFIKLLEANPSRHTGNPTGWCHRASRELDLCWKLAESKNCAAWVQWDLRAIYSAHRQHFSLNQWIMACKWGRKPDSSMLSSFRKAKGVRLEIVVVLLYM